MNKTLEDEIRGTADWMKEIERYAIFTGRFPSNYYETLSNTRSAYDEGFRDGKIEYARDLCKLLEEGSQDA